jgi:hypothetical protein
VRIRNKYASGTITYGAVMVWIWGLERSYGVTTVASSGVQKALRFETGYAALHDCSCHASPCRIEKQVRFVLKYNDVYTRLAKVRGSKERAQKCNVERFNLRMLNELEVRKQYQLEISNRFATLQNLKVMASTYIGLGRTLKRI